MPHAHAFFEKPIRATGPLAAANPFRSSTKYQDAETDLLYYGYRYYSPSLGRWLSRDPIGEIGGLNLQGFVANAPTSAFDLMGLDGDPWNSSVWRDLPKAVIPILAGAGHSVMCNLIAGLVREYLRTHRTPEEVRAWDRYVSGSMTDIELTELEMDSVLRGAPAFQAQLQAEVQAQGAECSSTACYWTDRQRKIDAQVGTPWEYALGRVTFTLTTACACRTLYWEACIFDKYDFDPTWFRERKGKAEVYTIAIWVVQNATQCGWRPFHHKGCKYGSN